MKRRTFLHLAGSAATLPIFSAFSAIPPIVLRPSEQLPFTVHPEREFLTDQTRITVVGIGGFGALAASRLARIGLVSASPHMKVSYCGVDTNRTSALLTDRLFPVYIVPKSTVRLPMGNAASDHQNLQVQCPWLAGVLDLSFNHMTLLISGLGGKAGTHLTRGIAGLSQAHGNFTVAMVALPAQLDARAKAFKELHHLERAAHATFVFDNAEIMARLGVDAPAQCQSSACDERLASCARQLLSTLIPFSPVAFDFCDLRTIFSTAGLSRHTHVIGHCEDLDVGTGSVVFGNAFAGWKTASNRCGLVALSARPGTLASRHLMRTLTMLHEAHGESASLLQIVAIDDQRCAPGLVRADAWLGGISIPSLAEA